MANEIESAPLLYDASATEGGDLFGPQAEIPVYPEVDISQYMPKSKAGRTRTQANLTPEARALLDTIAGSESPDYSTIYGGRKFHDFSDHPGVDVPIASGPNQGRTSSAAGRYQFLQSTWKDQQRKLGLQDFSPENQDRAAWNLAQESYANKTGRDLQSDLASGNPALHARIGHILSNTWTSLPGGIEQGQNMSKFIKNYHANLGNYPEHYSPEDISATRPQQEQEQPDLSNTYQIPLSNGQILHAPKGVSREDAIKQAQEAGVQAEGLKDIPLANGKTLHYPESMDALQALQQAREANPDMDFTTVHESKTGFVPAVKSGFESAVGQMGVGAGETAKALGFPNVGEYLGGKGEEYLKKAKETFEPTTEEEAAQGIMPWMRKEVGERAGQVLGGVAPYIATAPLGELALPAVAAGTFAQSVGGLKEKAEETNKPFEFGEALPYAAGETALNVAGLGLGPLQKAFKGTIAETISSPFLQKSITEIAETQGYDAAKEAIGSTLGNVAKQMGANIGGFALGDISTNILDRAYAGQELTSDDALNQYWESAKTDLVGGAMFGVPHGIRAKGERAAEVERVGEEMRGAAPEPQPPTAAQRAEMEKAAREAETKRQSEEGAQFPPPEGTNWYDQLGINKGSKAYKDLAKLEAGDVEHHEAIKDILDRVAQNPKANRDSTSIENLYKYMESLPGEEAAKAREEFAGRMGYGAAPVTDRLGRTSVQLSSVHNPEVRAAADNKDVAGVLDGLAQSKNPAVRWIAEKAKDLPDLTISSDAKKVRDLERSNGQKAGTYGGFYDPRNGEVVLAPRWAGDEHVVGHELLHGVTVRAINNLAIKTATNAALNPEERRQLPSYNGLVKLHNTVKDHPTLKKEYGITNVKDFVAEGLANPEFQYKLSRIRYEGTTLWGKFTQSLANLLGMQRNNAFMELVTHTENLVSKKPTKVKTSEPGEIMPSRGGEELRTNKVVDTEGKPLTMYHGSDAEIASFDREGLGSHFTSDKTVAQAFADSFDKKGHVIPVNLDIKNPLRVNDFGGSHSDATAVAKDFVKQGILPKDYVDDAFYSRVMKDVRGTKEEANEIYRQNNAKELARIRDELEKQGYDGLVYDNKVEGGGDTYVPFREHQITVVKKPTTKPEIDAMEVSRASKIESSKSPDAGGRPRPESGEKVRYPAESREGVRVSDQEGQRPTREGEADQNAERLLGRNYTKSVDISEKKSLLQKIKDFRAEYKKDPYKWMTRVRAALVTKYAPFSDALKDKAFIDSEGKLRADLLGSAHQQRMNTLQSGYEQGVPVLNSWGGVSIAKNDALAPGKILDRIDNLKQFSKPRDVVSAVLRALRGEEILNSDAPEREKVVTEEGIADAKALLAEHPEVQKIVDDIHALNQHLLKTASDSGLISKEVAAEWAKNKRYIPLYKSVEDILVDPESANFLGGGAKTVAEFKKLMGGEHEVNALENLQKHYAFITLGAAENTLRKNAAAQLEQVGAMKPITEAEAANNPLAVMFKEDGKKVYYECNDPVMYQAFQNIQPLTHPFFKFARGMTRFFRAATIVNPVFWYKQLIRDPIHASLVSGTGWVTPYDSAKAMMKILAGKSETYNKLSREGIVGAIDSLSDPKRFAESMRRDPQSLFQKTMGKLSHIHESSDAATRVAVYEAAMKQAKKLGYNEEKAHTYATMKAREVINFSNQGRSQALQAMRSTVPFLSAAINSLDVIARAATSSSVPPAERQAAKRLFYSRVASLAAISTGYALMMQDDKEYQKLQNANDWAMNYLIPNPAEKGTFIKVPVPFEIGFFTKILPELFVRVNSGTLSKREAKNVADQAFFQSLPPLPIPLLFRTPMETAMNYDLFTRRSIEGRGEENIPVEERGRHATELAKFMSKDAGLSNIGLSPAKIDHLGKGFATEIWAVTTTLADAYLNRNKPMPEKTTRDIPLMHGLVTKPGTDRAVNNFYELETQAKEVYSSMQRKRTTGRLEEFKKDMADPEKSKLYRAEKPLRNIADNMAKVRKQMEIVRSNKNLTSAQMTAEIERLNKVYNNMASTGYQTAKRLGLE